MRNRLMVMTLAASALVSGVGYAEAQAQQPNVTNASKAAESTAVQNRMLGEVMTIDAGIKQLSLRTADGKLAIITLNASTLYSRVPPGEINLDKAVSIRFADIGVGDRVLARGKVDEKQQSFAARMLIVMSKSEVAEKHERDRAAWLKRGVAGVITALNPEKKEITLRTGSGAGSNAVITAAAAAGGTFRRYAPGSVKFRDAKLSSFDELKVGDQLRALGEKSADGTRYVAEEVVSGTFRTTGGKITAIDPATGEVKITDAQTQKPVTVIVIQDSMLRRLSPELVKFLQQTGSRSSTPDASGGQPNQGDLQDRVEKSAVITLAELKPGDAILVSSIAGADPTRITAVLVAAGVEEIVKRQMQQPSRPALNLGLGLPSGSL
jgi:hypothetical protein